MKKAFSAGTSCTMTKMAANMAILSSVLLALALGATVHG
jgi:hypothetical protein